MSVEKSEIKLYKESIPFEVRSKNAKQLMANYPGKCPVVLVQDHSCAISMPNQKLLVKGTLSVFEFVRFLRNQVVIGTDDGFYIFVGELAPAQTTTIEELYMNYADEDGYLYVLYAVQEDKGSL